MLKPKVQTLLEQQRNRRALQQLSLELESARAFNASVLANVAEGILVVDEAGTISFANPAICQLLNTSVDHLRGTQVLDYIIEPKVGHWLDSGFYQHYRKSDTYRVHDAILRTAQGTQLPVALSRAALPAEQKAMVLTVLDMSVVRDLYQQLEKQAVTDALTGLLNRRGLYQAVESMLLRNERADKYRSCCSWIWMASSKSTTHWAMKRVIRYCSGSPSSSKATMRPYDVLARIGGDEFTVVIDGLDYPEQAAKIAEKLIERVSGRRQVDGVEITLGASVGIATFPDCGSNLTVFCARQISPCTKPSVPGGSNIDSMIRT